MSLPTAKRLTLTWAVLMALTLVSLIAGRAGGAGAGTLGLLPVAVVLAVTFFKAHRILMVYLNLRSSTPMWRGTFTAMLIALCAVIMAAYALSL